MLPRITDSDSLRKPYFYYTVRAMTRLCKAQSAGQNTILVYSTTYSESHLRPNASTSLR